MAATRTPAWVHLPWRPVLTATAAGLALLLGAGLWPDTAVMRLGVWSGLAVLGAAAAFAWDERAAEVVRSTPVGVGPGRTAARMALAALPLPLGLGALALVDARAQQVVWVVPAVELTGLVLAAIGAAAALSTRTPAPGERVAEATVLVVLTACLANPAARWVEVLPLAMSAGWGRAALLWAVVSAVSLALIRRAARDPLP